MNSCRRIAFIAIISFFLSTSLALAHKIQLFAYVDKGKVYAESYFADGSPVKSGKIEVYGKDGSKITEGVTDDKGMFSFPVPKDPVGVKIVVDAGMGHKAEYILKKEDVGQ
ncbi:MAG: carboxypeptidase regulatory-like domain-containing protein [Thermodesulforhabdaceae bacterium]